MAPLLPISLSGNNLGHRHKQFNGLVDEAYQNGATLASVKDIPEKSALDRLFKIDLATKFKDVDYTIQNLKHEEMLYVSRALKYTWLLDSRYSEIIRPTYLEEVLFPAMTTTAVTKIKHWIEKNLKDPKRNREFYQYYLRVNVNTSLRFLWKCSPDFILREVSKESLLEHLEPHHLKLLIEKCPDVAKVYFENLGNNEKLKTKYLQKELKYYNALKLLMKVNGDAFLNITEKYFNSYKFSRFSPEATKYIIKHYKARFDKKPELYIYYLFDMETSAKYLSVVEIKDLILKLARATYLQHWFSYEKVEPLLKRLSVEERTPFKKLVFVDKTFGETVEDWPYETPSQPVNLPDNNVFKDTEHHPTEYEFYDECVEDDQMTFRCLLRKRKYIVKKKKGRFPELSRSTSLDKLFDRYRFVGFEKALFDLRKQLTVETLQHRQNIMLVLISKSGGRKESLENLLKLLTTHHENEPDHLRATVIRSLVRRCNAWRLPQNVWELLMKFGRGVGLDGSHSTVACREGLHCVIIRNILLEQEVNAAVWKAFMKDFSTLKEYSLDSSEKEKISSKLPQMLIFYAKNEPNNDIGMLEKAFDTLDEYKIRVDKCPNFVKVISETAQKNPNAEKLIRRLFNAKIARKELFKENFAVIQNNASYHNALKHDGSILASGEKFDTLIKRNELAHDKFIKALSLYFNEENGLASTYLSLLKNYTNNGKMTKNKLARYIAILAGESMLDIMQEFNESPKKTDPRRFSASLRANSHLTRPLINLNASEWRSIGAKAVANRVLKCSEKNVKVNIQLLMSWSRTQKLALIQSMRIGKEATILEAISTKRPRYALKTILKHLKTKKLDQAVWNIILKTIQKVNAIENNNSRRLLKALSNVDIVPDDRKAEYCMSGFQVFSNKKNSEYATKPMLCSIELLLPEVDPAFIETVILRFLNEEFTFEKVSEQTYTYDICVCLYMRIVAKYLLLCKSDIVQEKKWENCGKHFFHHFESVWNKCKDKSNLMDYLDEFFLSLKYTKIFVETEYMSCIPMFEKIINRLQDILPIHKHFEKYVRLHLTMLYFKSIRQSIKNNPTVFDDLPKNVNRTAEIVGRIFGKLVAREVCELMRKYFDSIIEIYKDELIIFLDKCFPFCESWKLLATNVVKSILDCENIRTHVLAVHIYGTFMHQNLNNWSEKERDEIFKVLNESQNMEVLTIMCSQTHTW